MENSNPAISIIIPVYNAEKYLGECLDSILTQTFKNFEVIVVDDCSTDNSFEIAESYIPKFSIFSMCGGLKLAKTDKNSGSSAAPRNKGIELARGEYIFFVDNDDVLSPTTFGEIYPIAKKFDAEILNCNGHYFFYGDNMENSQINSFTGVKMADDIEIVENPLKTFLDGEFTVFPWRYLFRRDFVLQNKIKFPNVFIGEDHFFVFCAMCFVKKVVRVSRSCYYHRLIDTSISTRELPPKELFDRRTTAALAAVDILEKFIEDNSDFFQEHSDLKFAAFNKLLLGLINPAVTYELNKKVPLSVREEIVRDRLKNVQNSEYLTNFLFNKMLDLLVAYKTENAEVKRLQKKVRPSKKLKR